MNSNNKVYNIIRTTKNGIEENNLSLNDITSNKVNGFVISDFLNQQEVVTMLSGFRSIQAEELIHINESFDSYPMSFAQYDQMLERNIIKNEDYFNVSEKFISNFPAKFGVNITQKLIDVFSNITNAPPIFIPNDNDQRPYVPFTFRELFPGEGCLKAHCENLFFQEFPSFFSKINTFSTLENQLSFFIVLQKPQIGGELTLFDIIWNEKQKRPNDDEIILENGTTHKFENDIALKRDYINPEVGSLVVFTGGKIWHRVEKVKLAPSRITLGGFLSFSHDGQKLYTWS